MGFSRKLSNVPSDVDAHHLGVIHEVQQPFPRHEHLGFIRIGQDFIDFLLVHVLIFYLLDLQRVQNSGMALGNGDRNHCF